MNKKQEKRNLALANEIRQWLLDNEIWIDTVIYFNGKAYAPWDAEMKHFYYNDPEHLIEYEADPSRVVEYFNKETITMTFEGPLYDLINYDCGSSLTKAFDAIFKKYGMYYEQGYAWSLAAYEM